MSYKKHATARDPSPPLKGVSMRKSLWTAAAVVLAVSGAALAADRSSPGGSANPASEKGVKTPQQPNETQPGMGAGTGDRKGDNADTKGAKSEKGASKGTGKGEMKGDAMGGGSGMKGGSGMSSGSSNPGNPAEKGVKTPAQPNETQPGMGSNKK
jgi:hypothetical protein